jgi:formate dehydrogenase subunit delta
MSETGHLVQMANDIGNFFRAQDDREEAILGIANHIRNFWTPRMREKVTALLERDGAGFDELPREALRRLAANQEPTSKPPAGGDAG